MRVMIRLATLIFIGQGVAAFCGQSGSGHKSEAEIARMTPEQRVDEYCREYLRHDVWHRDYSHLLANYIMRDGLEAVPALAKIIKEFDPTRSGGWGDKNRTSETAEVMLSDIDQRVVRLRAFEEGRLGIDAVKDLLRRMRNAGFDTAVSEGERSKRSRYGITQFILENLEGNNDYDRSIQHTLELRHRIQLSDKELTDFVAFLISRDPHYPSWSKTAWYRDTSKRNEAGNPLQYAIVEDIGPFYEAYLKYKAKRE